MNQEREDLIGQQDGDWLSHRRDGADQSTDQCLPRAGCRRVEGFDVPINVGGFTGGTAPCYNEGQLMTKRGMAGLNSGGLSCHPPAVAKCKAETSLLLTFPGLTLKG